MKILLDIDDTVFIRGDLHPSWSDFVELVKREDYRVVVWSSNEDGLAIAKLMGFDFVSKNEYDSHPLAKVLIDDCCDLNKQCCRVEETFESLDSFMEKYDRV